MQAIVPRACAHVGKCSLPVPRVSGVDGRVANAWGWESRERTAAHTQGLILDLLPSAAECPLSGIRAGGRAFLMPELGRVAHAAAPHSWRWDTPGTGALRRSRDVWLVGLAHLLRVKLMARSEVGQEFPPCPGLAGTWEVTGFATFCSTERGLPAGVIWACPHALIILGLELVGPRKRVKLQSLLFRPAASLCQMGLSLLIAFEASRLCGRLVPCEEASDQNPSWRLSDVV